MNMKPIAVVIHLCSDDQRIGEPIPVRIVDLDEAHVHFTSDNPINVGQQFAVLFERGGTAVAWSLYRVVACRPTTTKSFIIRARFWDFMTGVPEPRVA